jgi:hypothetical protein
MTVAMLSLAALLMVVSLTAEIVTVVSQDYRALLATVVS